MRMTERDLEQALSSARQGYVLDLVAEVRRLRRLLLLACNPPMGVVGLEEELRAEVEAIRRER